MTTSALNASWIAGSMIAWLHASQPKLMLMTPAPCVTAYVIPAAISTSVQL